MAQLPSYFTRHDESQAFRLASRHHAAGDQPRAIADLCRFIRDGASRSVLLGVTGSGKTFTMANVIAELQRPALILAHNKTLAAQLYSEFRELFPDNAVRYFVSYYDYYQPEAYVPSTDTYIEKDASINDEIDKLRHAATKALLERRDTLVVASVSCIYGLGDPRQYFDMMLYLEVNDCIDRDAMLKKLVELQYTRNELDFQTGTFRVRGDVVEICPASEDEISLRIEFFGDEVERISEIERLSGKVRRAISNVCIYPASHFVTTRDKVERAITTIREELEECVEFLERSGKILEAQRLESRTRYDLELLDEMGFCPGVENYSRHLTGRAPGEAPPTLIDYFPEDALFFLDESHVTLPQIRGMFRGDQARKQTLVEHGFRLPSALDNRPLQYEEFAERARQLVYVSATPGETEYQQAGQNLTEQIIRPTGLLDPVVEIVPARTQVEHFLGEVQRVVERGERVLVTTLTKKMAEDLAEYYREVGVRIKYLHSSIHTLDRVELIRALRAGLYDVLVGVNLLREGLDLPEVSLVGIFDADKEGFLRSGTSLIQTIGRAARNAEGRVILYADKETDSIRRAIEETNRRRAIQEAHNKEHGITPTTVIRAQDAPLVEQQEHIVEESSSPADIGSVPRDAAACAKEIASLQKEMRAHADRQEYEAAAVLRDRIQVLRNRLLFES